MTNLDRLNRPPLILKRIIGSSMCIFCVFPCFRGPVTNFIGCFLLLWLVRRLWTPRSPLAFNFGTFGRFCPNQDRGYAESIGILNAVKLNFFPPHSTLPTKIRGPRQSTVTSRYGMFASTSRSPNFSEMLANLRTLKC